MNRYRLTYTYADGGIEVEYHYEATLRDAIHQGLVRPSVVSFLVEKLEEQ